MLALVECWEGLELFLCTCLAETILPNYAVLTEYLQLIFMVLYNARILSTPTVCFRVSFLPFVPIIMQ